MSRIFEALQKSSAGKAGGFTDFATALQEPFSAVVETGTAETAATALPVADFDDFPTVNVSLRPGSRLFCLTQRESLGAEKFRFLGVRLRQLQQNRALKRILVTSTIPEEGKSTISGNLACTLARKRQQKVLLIDGDLRRPSLNRLLGLDRMTGLSEYLKGEASLREPLYRVEEAGFWFLPAGTPPENPLDLMNSARYNALLERLSGWFDWIVIDTPPVLPLADTSVWAKAADGILLVTREGTTRKRHLQRGIAALDAAKLLGVVINSTHSTEHDNYYQHYGPAAKQASDRK
jgi:capsular exopolysaccharide synthesis family protein